MQYWIKLKEEILSKLNELNDLLGDWQNELRLSQMPDKKRMIKSKINDLIIEISELEKKLMDIDTKISNSKDTNSLDIKKLSIHQLELDENSEMQQKLIKTNSTTPYKYGVITKREETKTKIGRYIIEDNEKNYFFCTYADLLTEGYRTIKVGDKVRFVSKKVNDEYLATFIIKIESDYSHLYYK